MSVAAVTSVPTATRFVLRPGVRVLRRDPTHRQVGVDDLAVVVPDGPAVDPVLDALDRGRAVDRALVEPRLLAALLSRDLLVDAEVLGSLTPIGLGLPETVHAAFAAHGSRAVTRLAARRARPVEVRGPAAWSAEAESLLGRGGVAVRPGEGRGARGSADRLLLVLAAGEPRRADLDEAVQTGRPHLVVSSVQGRLGVGPFVVPGVTACVRCLDAHAAECDPRRALVVEQLASAGTGPVDPVLGTLALSLAVRDVLAWLEGERPTTWSATVTVSAGGDLLPRRWSPHPCCGCRWGDRLPVP